MPAFVAHWSLLTSETVARRLSYVQVSTDKRGTHRRYRFLCEGGPRITPLNSFWNGENVINGFSWLKISIPLLVICGLLSFSTSKPSVAEEKANGQVAASGQAEEVSGEAAAGPSETAVLAFALDNVTLFFCSSRPLAAKIASRSGAPSDDVRSCATVNGCLGQQSPTPLLVNCPNCRYC